MGIRLTTGQAGKRVGRTAQTIRTWIHGGLLRGYRVGPRNFMVDQDELDALVVQLHGTPEAAA
ncbi:DNA-binding protein [Nocardia sp. NPDC050175]|uniref:DNA-binding protein n=1 Tax=Nocardia sp. NPDC050175 TaxID=3364317 RepID=UPI0037A8D10E